MFRIYIHRHSKNMKSENAQIFYCQLYGNGKFCSRAGS